MKITKYQIVVLTLVYLIGLAYGTSLEEDLRITPKQKGILDKFRQRVAPRLPHAYMKEDIYLIRWLRARDFDMQQAEHMLNENLKWRKANKIDGILKENWSYFNHETPHFLNTLTRDNKPIMAGNLGSWDLRKIALSGRTHDFYRYLYMCTEEAVTKVREFQAQGKNVSQYTFLVNMDNYNVIQHGCVPCAAMYIELITFYENYYPGFVDQIVMFNSPPVFEAILRLIRPIMSPMTQKSLKVIGHDPALWQKVLYGIADKGQLRPEYGGTYNE